MCCAISPKIFSRCFCFLNVFLLAAYLELLSLFSLTLFCQIASSEYSLLSAGDEARTLAFCDTVRKVGRGAVNERLLVLSATHMQLLRFA